MLHKIIIILIYFFSIAVNSQNFIKIKTKAENTPLKNVLTQNISEDVFVFSNANGISKLKYTNSTDSIRIFLPGYIPFITTIKSLQNSNALVLLDQELNYLEKAVIIAKTTPPYDYKFDFGHKKKYFITITGINPGILTSYTHKKRSKFELIAVKFFFNNTDISSNKPIFIRPLICNSEMKQLLITPNLLEINDSSNGSLINFSKKPIPFKKHRTYYIGFEIINKNNKTKKLKVRGLTKNGTSFLLRPNPISKWFKQKDGVDFSLDYVLYFKKD